MVIVLVNQSTKSNKKKRKIGSINNNNIKDMYCKHCGKQIADDSTFCQYCGGKVDTPAQEPKEDSTVEQNEQPAEKEQQQAQKDPQRQCHQQCAEGGAGRCCGI